MDGSRPPLDSLAIDDIKTAMNIFEGYDKRMVFILLTNTILKRK